MALIALDQSPLRREEQARVARLAACVAFIPGGRMLAGKRLRAFPKEMNELLNTAAQINQEKT